jgi:hypothetical protein
MPCYVRRVCIHTTNICLRSWLGAMLCVQYSGFGLPIGTLTLCTVTASGGQHLVTHALGRLRGHTGQAVLLHCATACHIHAAFVSQECDTHVALMMRLCRTPWLHCVASHRFSLQRCLPWGLGYFSEEWRTRGFCTLRVHRSFLGKECRAVGLRLRL